MKNENQILRKLLWLNHGCPFSALYGDDGEMQCHKCIIDFKRNPIEIIEQKFFERNTPEDVKKVLKTLHNQALDLTVA